MKKSENTVLWWLGWIALTLVSFFVSCYFWTLVIARYVGSMQKPGVPLLWVVAVFGTWLLLLLPLMVVMYMKVDKAYEDARMSREKAAALRQTQKNSSSYKSTWVADDRRILSKEICKKLKFISETMTRGHLVTAVLSDGRRIENVFILDGAELLGVYGADQLTFNASDIVDVEPVPQDRWPNFKINQWLRLDGAGLGVGG